MAGKCSLFLQKSKEMVTEVSSPPAFQLSSPPTLQRERKQDLQKDTWSSTGVPCDWFVHAPNVPPMGTWVLRSVLLKNLKAADASKSFVLQELKGKRETNKTNKQESLILGLGLTNNTRKIPCQLRQKKDLLVHAIYDIIHWIQLS